MVTFLSPGYQGITYIAHHGQFMLHLAGKVLQEDRAQIKHKLWTIPSQSQHVTAFYFKKIDFSGFNVPFFASLLLSSFKIKVIL